MKNKKNKLLYDVLGICCGLAVVATGLIHNAVAPKTAAAENAQAAGTVLAVAEAEHTGKGVAKQVKTMSGVTVLHAADW